MKQLVLVFSIVLLAMGAFANDTIESEAKNKNISQEKINVPHSLLRGTVNLVTFWMEIPRELVVESNYNPVYGIVTGLVKGSYFSGKRLVYSVLDFVLLGFTGPSGYDVTFPEYVWNAQWNPWPKKAVDPE